MRQTILHISCDYPDPLNMNKTKAVLNLVEGTPEYRHVVYSLNRFTAWRGIYSLPFGEDLTAVAYGALPKGLFWEGRLDAVADWIIADLRSKGIKPDLVEAHKITVEGLIGEKIADEFECPLICDIQGNSDVKILNAKIGMRARLRRVAQRSSLIFPYAPWSVEPFEKKIGLSPEKCTMLPVMPGVDCLSPAPVLQSTRLMSMFDLDRWREKNFDGLVRAFLTVRKGRPSLSLDVYGRGRTASLASAERFLATMDIQGSIKLCGPVQNNNVPALMKNYDAFVMPTHTESYGLVHVEALFAGVPVLFSKGRGIDGYFDEKTIGYACDPSSVADIAKGMAYLLDNEAALKKSIADLQSSGAIDKLRKTAILDVYRKGLQSVLSTYKG